MGTITKITTSFAITIVTGMIRVSPMFPHQIGKLLLGMEEVVFKDMLQKMMRRFDASDDNVKR